MKRSSFIRSMAVCIVTAVAMMVTQGCSSSPNAKATVDSMSTFGTNTAKAKDAIDVTVKALEKLVASDANDIRPNLSAYSQSVAALDAQAKVVKADADKMKATGDAFFKEWEGSENITPERRAELSSSYAQIKTDMIAARDAFTPFLASLKDIESYLNLDPSVKGINSMSSLVAKAKTNGMEVKTHVDAVLTRVNSVRGMLMTKPK